MNVLGTFPTGKGLKNSPTKCLKKSQKSKRSQKKIKKSCTNLFKYFTSWTIKSENGLYKRHSGIVHSVQFIQKDET